MTLVKVAMASMAVGEKEENRKKVSHDEWSIDAGEPGIRRRIYQRRDAAEELETPLTRQKNHRPSCEVPRLPG